MSPTKDSIICLLKFLHNLKHEEIHYIRINKKVNINDDVTVIRIYKHTILQELKKKRFLALEINAWIFWPVFFYYNQSGTFTSRYTYESSN